MNSAQTNDQPDPQQLEREALHLLRHFKILRGNGGFIMITAAGILGTIAGGTASVALIVLSVACGVLGILLQLFLRPTYAQLAQRAKDDQEHAAQATKALQGALGSVLRTMAKRCSFDGNDQRISIYCHVDDEFVLLARHSSNPAFEQPGRPSYPAGEGVIGQAWQLGNRAVWDWPTTPDEWIEHQKKLYDFPEEDLRKIRMKSGSMVALRLSHGADRVGVIVMESLKARGARKRHLQIARDSMLLECICEILASAQPQFPAVAEYVVAKANRTA